MEEIVIPNITPRTRMSFIILQSEKKRDLVCAEVGVWIGENAENMLDIDSTMQLHLIDAYTNVGYTDDMSQGTPDEVKQKAKTRVEKYGDRVKFIYKQSEEAYKDYPDEYFDYIYVDADHSYYGAYRDMKCWWPKVKKGGMFAGHDISMNSVSKAFIDFLLDVGRLGDGKKIEGNGESDWWLIK